MEDAVKRDSEWWSSHGPESTMARRVKALRLKLGISQRDLADQMREQGFAFEQATVSRIESGDRSIGLNEAAALAAILKIPPGRRSELLETREDDDDLVVLQMRMAQLVAEHDRIAERRARVSWEIEQLTHEAEHLRERRISRERERQSLDATEMMAALDIAKLRGRIEEMQMVAIADSDHYEPTNATPTQRPTTPGKPGSPRGAVMRTGNRPRRG